MCEFALEKVAEGVSIVSTAWIPRKPWVAALAGFAFWYGRRVALTYAPGVIANFLINTTANYMIGGSFIGATVVAPMLTPSIVPWVALAFGCALFYLISVISNFVQKYIFERYCC